MTGYTVHTGDREIRRRLGPDLKKQARPKRCQEATKRVATRQRGAGGEEKVAESNTANRSERFRATDGTHGSNTDETARRARKSGGAWMELPLFIYKPLIRAAVRAAVELFLLFNFETGLLEGLVAEPFRPARRLWLLNLALHMLHRRHFGAATLISVSLFRSRPSAGAACLACRSRQAECWPLCRVSCQPSGLRQTSRAVVTAEIDLAVFVIARLVGLGVIWQRRCT